MSESQDWSKVDTNQPMHDFLVNPSAQGTLVEVKRDIGPNLAKIYVLKQEDGTEIGVWGGTIIDDKMSRIPVGNMVKIDFLGVDKTKDGKRTFKNFDVFTKAAPMVRVESESVEL